MYHSKVELNVKDQATESAGTVNGPTRDVKSSKAGIFSVICTQIGTSLAVKIQGSPDGTNWADLPSAAFASITATGTFWLEWYGTHFLPRYIRAVGTVVGTAAIYRVDAALDPIV